MKKGHMYYVYMYIWYIWYLRIHWFWCMTYDINFEVCFYLCFSRVLRKWDTVAIKMLFFSAWSVDGQTHTSTIKFGFHFNHDHTLA